MMSHRGRALRGSTNKISGIFWLACHLGKDIAVPSSWQCTHQFSSVQAIYFWINAFQNLQTAPSISNSTVLFRQSHTHMLIGTSSHLALKCTLLHTQKHLVQNHCSVCQCHIFSQTWSMLHRVLHIVLSIVVPVPHCPHAVPHGVWTDHNQLNVEACSAVVNFTWSPGHKELPT